MMCVRTPGCEPIIQVMLPAFLPEACFDLFNTYAHALRTPCARDQALNNCNRILVLVGLVSALGAVRFRDASGILPECFQET